MLNVPEIPEIHDYCRALCDISGQSRFITNILANLTRTLSISDPVSVAHIKVPTATPLSMLIARVHCGRTMTWSGLVKSKKKR
ncbi:hypothetical protein BC940DRAFT_286769 [Gongronella butleri]|nr:hypothetical protein BC940DRAFT_286769 [Gongronella butleri]